ncbi:MAG: HAMP domain-containing histidine kinase [Actinomycetota bacterium]|nr:HAMP domain-containing histidine kinase [Actinomycetota bacterium]
MPRRRLRRLATVRVRTTIAATAVVAVALAAGGAVLVSVLSTSLEHNRQSVAITQASDIANLAASGHLPSVLASPNEETTLSQVVDQHNAVVAASANITGEPPVASFLALGDRRVVHRVQTLTATDGGPSLLVAFGGRLGGRPVTVFTAVSLEATDAAVQTVIVGLAVGLPFLLLLVAATTWVIVGRALRPIEAIRAEVSEISDHDLHRRVPHPAVDDEVGRLARTMNSMLDRLETSSEQQRRFVADASHELRSPLAAIRTELEVGLARGASTDWPATAGEILLDEARMERLVTSLLALARLEADPRPPTTEPVDLGTIVAEDAGARDSSGAVTVRTEVTAGVHALISAFQARQIVANLVDNALRHARHEVVVTVERGGDGMARLVVADDGPGIPPADREVVFERFTRLDESRSHDAGGAGLGLAIVRDIVVRHQGKVDFTDGAVGARIVVALPS